MKNTDQISAFLELDKSDQVIKNLLDNAPVGIALINRDGFFFDVNPLFAYNTGYDIEDLRGMRATELTCPLFLNLHEYKFSKIAKGEIESFCLVKQCFNRRGEAADIRVNVRSYYSEKNDITFFIAFYQLSPPFYNRYFSMLHPGFRHEVRNNPAPGILISNFNGRVLFGSKFAASILGYSEIEIADKLLPEIMNEDHASKLLNLIHWKNHKDIIEYEFEFHHKKGGNIFVTLKVLIDDTNFFKNGRMLLMVFKTEPLKYIYQQTKALGCCEAELLAEVKKLRDQLQMLHNNSSKENLSGSDINISDFNLTAREREILFLLVERKNAKEIAWELNLAEITVRKHFTSLYRKFGVSGKEDLLLHLHGKTII